MGSIEYIYILKETFVTVKAVYSSTILLLIMPMTRVRHLIKVLFDLVLILLKGQRKGRLMLYVAHVLGTRMIKSGIDGI